LPTYLGKDASTSRLLASLISLAPFSASTDDFKASIGCSHKGHKTSIGSFAKEKGGFSEGYSILSYTKEFLFSGAASNVLHSAGMLTLLKFRQVDSVDKVYVKKEVGIA